MSYRAMQWAHEKCPEVRGIPYLLLDRAAWAVREDLDLLFWASERQFARLAHVWPTTVHNNLPLLIEHGYVRDLCALSRTKVLRRIAVPDDFGTAGELKAHDDALRFLSRRKELTHSDVLTIVEVVAATATRRGAVEGATTAPQGGAVDRDDDDPSARATAHTTAHTTASHGRAEIREDLEVSGTDQADLSDFHSGGTRPSVAQSDAEVARARAHVREGEGENDDDELDGFVVDLAKRKRMREQR